ncbi:MAG: winged helix-turn-helix domain-containing protein [Novosphingobium sp.]
MEAADFPSPRRAAQDLTRVEGFALGPLMVDPPSRRVSAGGRSEMLEPRVMRVLVAFGEARGKVLSRDDLITLCWDGVVVGNNAINQTISRLRHVFDDLSGGAVQLETITKVGFRLVYRQSAAEAVSSPAPEPVANSSANAESPFWTRKMTRRAAAGGIVLLGGGPLAYAVLDSPARHVPDPRARDLYQRGQVQLKAWELGSIRQAIAFNKQAVALDPEYADAWGALAISYVHGLDGLTAEAKAAYPRLVRSAAEQALALDPDQAEAHFALAIPDPHYRRWFAHEQGLRPLVRRFSNYWYGHTQLGILLLDVARYEEAIVSLRRAREIDPMVPITWGRLAQALQAAGRDQEVDLVLDEALARWPEHVHLWVARCSLLIEGRRFTEGAAFCRDPTRRPMKLPEEVWRSNEGLATALATGEGAEMVAKLARSALFAKPGYYGLPISWLAALGAVEQAFDALEAYYFGGMFAGTHYPPPGPFDKRPNFHLFSTYILEHREHSRFKALLERSGLEDYWRRSRTQPDFRRA